MQAMSDVRLDGDGFHLIYLEAFLEEYSEEVDYAEYSRVEPRWEWRKHLRIESFDSLDNALERAAELLWTAEYDYRVEILGIFRGDEMIYDKKEVMELSDDYLPTHVGVTA